jgi:hypothetical protein
MAKGAIISSSERRAGAWLDIGQSGLGMNISQIPVWERNNNPLYETQHTSDDLLTNQAQVGASSSLSGRSWK